MESSVTIVHSPHIGIVAGTAEGAAYCYRMLSQEADTYKEQQTSPEITLHTFPLQSYLELIDRDDWPEVGALMSRSAVKLAQAGAGIIICPNNTLHQAFDWVISPVPWLHIAVIVAAEAARRQFRLVGILGTQVVMEGSLYASKLKKHSIDWLIPSPDDRKRIQDMIRTQLISGQYTSESRNCLQRVITGMADKGVEAVILGCTELPLLISEEQSALPLLDSGRLLANAALQHATSSSLSSS